MKTQSTQEKYLHFLNSIAQRQRGFRNISKQLEKFKISKAIVPVLCEQRAIKKVNDVWKWNGSTPDMKMASQVLQNVNTSIREKASEYKAKSPKQQLPTFQNIKRSQVVIHKYVPKSNDILDIAKLRDERMKLQSKIEKIDSVLEAVDNFKK